MTHVLVHGVGELAVVVQHEPAPLPSLKERRNKVKEAKINICCSWSESGAKKRQVYSAADKSIEMSNGRVAYIGICVAEAAVGLST